MTTPFADPVPPPVPRPQGTTYTARTPEDLIAAVPVVLGFHPEDSLVLLTFGAARPFHARLDLPRTSEEVERAVAALVPPSRREAVAAAAVLAYADDGSEVAARRAARALARALDRAGVVVVDTLRADGHRWFALDRARHPGVPAWGVPYDLSSHPFTARAVFDGHAVLGSRRDLEAALQPDADGVAALRAALPGCRPCDPSGAVDVVARHLGTGAVPDADLAALLLGVRDLDVRDAVWTPIRRVGAREHVALWADAVRRAPDDLVAGPAAVLAFAAWAAGHGALAWCAVDRCVAVEPDNSLAALVADVLERAVPPDVLERIS